MTGDKPVGNVWSYDKENRKSFLDSYQENDIKFITNKYVTEAVIYIEKHFDENVGETDLYLPITHKDAEKWLHSFFKEKLKNFGAYEDAFRKDVVIGYHSCISALLNIGLLEPMYVIDAALNYARKHKIPIASLEGFIRQIISWREYVRMLYIMEHSRFNSENFFNHKNKISKKWYDGSTGILPIDNLIHKILKYSYCHHIERLMVIGNFFLISMVAPKEVYKWFITMISIDAYEWVMEPNIYGMSQHSVGTLMMTRPYFSSSNYLFNMSDYSKKEGYIDWDNDEIHWSEIWNALYYNFISNNKDYLKKIYSTANFVSFYNKKSKEEKNKIKKIAKTYMNDYL